MVRQQDVEETCKSEISLHASKTVCVLPYTKLKLPNPAPALSTACVCKKV